VLGIYLGTVVVMSLVLALMFDALWSIPEARVVGHEHGSGWLGTLSALVLLGLLAWLMLRRLQARQRPEAKAADGELMLQVQGMTCPHCVASVKQALEHVDGVDAADPDLGSGRVLVRGGHLDASALTRAVEGAGFQVKD
jgi:copper chaperone CopZ